jgi:hypothetical protein
MAPDHREWKIETITELMRALNRGESRQKKDQRGLKKEFEEEEAGCLTIPLGQILIASEKNAEIKICCWFVSE